MRSPPPSSFKRAIRRSARSILLGAVTVFCLSGSFIGTTWAQDWEMELPQGVWTQIHAMGSEDAVTFRFQPHGGSAFDTKRSQIFLFGSDTHGVDWTNSPFIFDLATLSWRRLYLNDPPESYRVTEEGLPVAGPAGDRPWAMHSFGAVDYDPRRDAVIVSSHPAHMVPGRFSDALADVWSKVRRHPTWLFDLQEERWRPLTPPDISFFAYATTYDSDRGVMIGTAYHGVFELRPDIGGWYHTAEGSTTGYHNNGAYDPDHKAVVLFGRNGLGDDVLIYRTDEAEIQAMPTPGTRPPRDEHAPMAYHPGLRETLVLVDRFEPGTPRRSREKGRAETWAYDLGRDRWRRIESADLPFALGMNYHLHYDPKREVLLLVTAMPTGTREDLRAYPEVWALKL